MDMNILNGLSDEAIKEYLEKYKDNPSVITQLQGLLESRAKNGEAAKKAFEAEAEAKVKESEFMESVAKLVKKLGNPPSTVLNIHLRWAKTLVKAEKEGEPEVEKWAWAYQANHVCNGTGKATADGKATPANKPVAKLEVTAYRMEADPTDATKLVKKVLGKYPNMRAACNANNVTETKASARQDAMKAGIHFEE